MGLLDDAIREHLELKRRHGADPDEVARQEREALGAPRRGEFAQPEAAAAAAPGEPVEAAPPAAEPEPEPVPPEPEPVAPIGQEEDPWLPDEVPEEETLEHPAPAAEGEDVLEETPEFLQETPEHER